MLKDIVKISDKVFSQFVANNKAINSPKQLYAVYVNLAKLIDATKLVSGHYLALEFDEEYLQNSSFGAPSDKWRYFLNKDLSLLNDVAKEYLMSLTALAPQETDGMFYGYMNTLYNSKIYYGFVRDEYSVGFVEPCSFSLISQTLTTKFDAQNIYIEEFNKVDLTHFEGRVALQTLLQQREKSFKSHYDALSTYMLHNYTLEDLL